MREAALPGTIARCLEGASSGHEAGGDCDMTAVLMAGLSRWRTTNAMGEKVVGGIMGTAPTE